MIKIFNREDLDGGKLEFWTKYNGSMDDINYFSRPGESVFPFYVSRPLNLISTWQNRTVQYESRLAQTDNKHFEPVLVCCGLF